MSMSNWILVDQQLDWLEMHSLGYLLRSMPLKMYRNPLPTHKTWLAFGKNDCNAGCNFAAAASVECFCIAKCFRISSQPPCAMFTSVRCTVFRMQRCLHRVRKKTALLNMSIVQITLWIENDSHYFSLYHEKPSICNVYVKFHDNQSVHCWDIALYNKMVENSRRQHCQLTRARNAYLRPPISTPAHCASAFT